MKNILKSKAFWFFIALAVGTSIYDYQDKQYSYWPVVAGFIAVAGIIAIMISVDKNNA